MRYKKMLFNMPADWDVNECFVSIKDRNIILDHVVNNSVFETERYISELVHLCEQKPSISPEEIQK